MPADPTKSHIAKTFDHSRPLISCRFDPTGRYVFAGAEDNRIYRWDIATGQKVELAGHESWVRSFAFDLKGQILISGGFDGRLVWWNTGDESPKPIRSVEAHQGWIRAMSVSPDGTMLVSCGNDLAVKIWNLGDGVLVREMRGHESHIYNVAWHPNGRDIVSGDLKANFIHWEASNGNIVRKFEAPALHKYDKSFKADIGGPHSMTFNTDGKLLACGGITNVSNAFAGVGNPAIVVFDWESAKEKVTHLSKAGVQGVAWGAILHPESFTIAATGGPGGGHLFFWKPDDKDEFHQFNLGNTARDLGMHPDGVQLATAHFDRKLRITRMATP